MNRPTPKIFYYTENEHLLFNSLRRYFKYVLNIDLKECPKNSSSCKIEILLISIEEKENPRLLDVLNKNSNIKALLIGFDDNCLINLVDTSSLKSKFSSLLNTDLEINFPMFTKSELSEKISLFFKDHGDVSLFDRLNDVRYRILNGIKLYKTDDLGFEDAKNEFLIPGVESWYKFKTRLEKYTPYLILLGYKTEQAEIKKLTERYDEFISEINSTLEYESLHINMETLNKNVEFVKKIDEILTIISNDLGIVNARLQDPSS